MPNEQMPMAQAQPEQAQAPQAPEQGGGFSTLLTGTSQGLAKIAETILKSPAASPQDKQNAQAALQSFQALQQGLEDDGQGQAPEQQGGVVPMETGGKKAIPVL